MTELDQLIAAAYESEGKQDDVNKMYLAFLQAPLFVPVQKASIKNPDELGDDEEPFKPLFAKLDDHYFMVSFDELSRLETWVGDQADEMDYVEITGKQVIAGISDEAYLCLNVGTPFYKEFSPDEIKRLKTIVSRIEQMKG